MEDRVLDWEVYEKTAREMTAEGLVLYLDVCRTIIIRVEPVRAAW